MISSLLLYRVLIPCYGVTRVESCVPITARLLYLTPREKLEEETSKELLHVS